jgi:hypothetical protein
MVSSIKLGGSFWGNKPPVISFAVQDKRWVVHDTSDIGWDGKDYFGQNSAHEHRLALSLRGTSWIGHYILILITYSKLSYHIVQRLNK